MDDKICIGDGIIIMSWKEPNSCTWSDDFDKSFKVIGFAEDFSTQGFKNHWRDVTENYDYINLDSIASVPMDGTPHLILEKPLSNGIEIIHPIFVRKDKKFTRTKKINNLLK